MAKAPKKNSKSPSSTPATPDTPASGLDATPLSPRDHLANVARAIAAERGMEVRDQEVLSVVDEQFISPIERAVARSHRRADESFCQAVENDQRFKEAVQVAKGGVF